MSSNEKLMNDLHICVNLGACDECSYMKLCSEELNNECLNALMNDVYHRMCQLIEERSNVDKIIHDQRHDNRRLHAQYEWAVEELRKNGINDRARLQAYLRKRGIDPASYEEAPAHLIESCTELICSACGHEFSDEIVFMSRTASYDEDWIKFCPACGKSIEYTEVVNE